MPVQNEIAYYISVQCLKKLLGKGLLSQEEYKKADEQLARHYGAICYIA